MRKFFLSFMLSVVSLWILPSELNAGNRDTAIYRRPYYLGVTLGYTAFTDGIIMKHRALALESERGPFDQDVWWGTSVGLSYAFPFASRFECELGAQYSFWKDRRSEITGINYSQTPPIQITGYNYTRRWNYTEDLSCRLHFSFELFRRNGNAIHFGAGGWGLALGKNNALNNDGLELILKSYIRVSGGGAFQIALAGGTASTGTYMQIRLTFALIGTRIYRHRPTKYYTRTYEEGE